jgi:hypothetical protein
MFERGAHWRIGAANWSLSAANREAWEAQQVEALIHNCGH